MSLSRSAARRYRSSGSGVAVFALILAGSLVLPVSTAVAQVAIDGRITRPPEVLHLYRSVKEFDFDERPRGNFEATPMYWVRLEGAGLPAFARGELDDDVGHAAPPSFRLRLSGIGSNVCYEYRHTDLEVSAGSDYQVVGYVRCDGIRYARAFIGAFLVDAGGRRIPGSENISPLVATNGAWERVELAIVGDFETAAAIRLQLWILQSHVWDENARRPDTIVREDVSASAWFDDISVYRLPRARLRLSSPGGLSLSGADDAFEIELSNLSNESLDARLVIHDADGRELLAIDSDLIVSEQARTRIPLPALPAGYYTCHLYLSSREKSLLERSVPFAVLTPVPAISTGENDVGVELERWRGTDSAGLEALATQLGCRAILLPLSLHESASDLERHEESRELAMLVRALVGRRIEPIGVLTDSGPHDEPRQDSPAALTAYFEERLGPALMQLGGALATWQLGGQPLDAARANFWDESRREAVRSYLSRHVTLPELVLPVLDPAAAIDARDILLVHIPEYIPTRGIVPQLEFLTEASERRRWISLRMPRAADSREMRIADQMRRFVLTKALAPDRIFLPACFAQSSDGGALAWHPTEEFIPFRTLIAFLAGKVADTVVHLDEDCLGIVFREPGRPREGVMVAWTWRDRPLSEPLRVYLGDQPHLIDLWGNRSDLRVEEGRTLLPLSPTPVIVDGVEAPLAHLAAGFSILPDRLDPSAPGLAPTIRFTNTFETTLVGRLDIGGPPSWRVSPAMVEFSIPAGETLERPLSIMTPPRQVATTESVRVTMQIRSPTDARLQFETPLTVGLRDIQVHAIARWEGPDLLVEQTLRNQSRQAVSFTGSCDAPLRSRIERAFMDVPPGEYRTHRYLIRDARELAGRRIRVGVSEIRGSRTMEQLVDIPD